MYTHLHDQREARVYTVSVSHISTHSSESTVASESIRGITGLQNRASTMSKDSALVLDMK